MPSVVVDTHALIWHLFDPNRLSVRARATLQTADIDPSDTIYASAISLVEIVYLIEKGKLPASHLADVIDAIQDVAVSIELLAIDISIGVSLGHIPKAVVPEMPDRIIAATAYARSLPLITRDRQIQQAPITTIW